MSDNAIGMICICVMFVGMGLGIAWHGRERAPQIPRPSQPPLAAHPPDMDGIETRPCPPTADGHRCHDIRCPAVYRHRCHNLDCKIAPQRRA